MAKVIRILRLEHRNMAKLLDALERQIAVFDKGGLPDYDVICRVLDYCMSFPEICHHPKEDLVFRKLRERDADAAETVGDLLRDHEELAALTAGFLAQVHNVLEGAELPRAWFGNIARGFVESYRTHMGLEEERFFPLALDKLTPDDWADIDARVRDRDDPLFGDKVEEDFRDLRAEILEWDRQDAAL